MLTGDRKSFISQLSFLALRVGDLMNSLSQGLTKQTPVEPRETELPTQTLTNAATGRPSTQTSLQSMENITVAFCFQTNNSPRALKELLI